MNIIKDKYEAAVKAKNNDVNSYVWKGPKEEVCGHKIQREIRLVDATDDQLRNFYKHCESMLYSTNPVDPGRVILINQIQQDRDKCTAELFVRYLENVYKHDDSRSICMRDAYREMLSKWLRTTTTGIKSSDYYSIPITEVSDDIPEEFHRLNVGIVKDACTRMLGKINKKPITLNFITNLGLWFTPAEMKDLTEKDPETGTIRDRKMVVKERLLLKNNIHIKIDPKGLNYNEFRDMIHLEPVTFYELSTSQLVTLKNKVLFRLEDEAMKHCEFWLDKERQIMKVAEMRGLELIKN